MSEIGQSTTDSDYEGSSSGEPHVIKVGQIPTIAERYKKSTLETPALDKVLYRPDSALLERISIHQGNITNLEVDSIVNAANKSLLGGGGGRIVPILDDPSSFHERLQLTARSITRLGLIYWRNASTLCNGLPDQILNISLIGRTLNGCMTGNSKITRGYCLPARYVIHTVGPVYSSNAAEEKARQLASCYRTSLEVAVENQIRHVAFPSVSTGIYGYPIDDATRIALNEVRRFVESERGKSLERVIFVVWSNKDLGVYESLVPEYFPPVQDLEEKNNNLQAPDLETKKLDA